MTPRSSADRSATSYFVTVGKDTVHVELEADHAIVDGVPMTADLSTLGDDGARSLLLDGESWRLVANRSGRGAWDMRIGGRSVQAEVTDERTHALRRATGRPTLLPGAEPLRAPMPGLVVRLEVRVGQQVTEGQGLVIVEAMKMENELCSRTAGRVTAIYVEEGDAVERDQMLMEFESVEEPPSSVEEERDGE